MKILFLASHLHMEGFGGGATYTRACLALLRAPGIGADVRLLRLSEPLSGWPRGLRKAAAMARSLLAHQPAKSLFAADPAGAAQVRREVRAWKPDLLVVNSAELLPLVTGLPQDLAIVLIAHNLEHRVLARMAETCRGIRVSLAKPLRREEALFRRLEEAAARRIAGVICISEADRDWFAGLNPDLATLTLPPLFEGPPYAGPRPAPPPLRIGMIAKMSWRMNREAVDWFVGQVLCRLDREDLEVHLYGPGSEAYRGIDRRLTAHGFVESLEPAWRDCHFHVCPTFLDTGANIKLAEALYNGLPVLATPAAARPFAAVPHGGALVAQRPEDWAGFLNSAAADGLVATVVSDTCRHHFSLDAWGVAAEEFVARAAG